MKLFMQYSKFIDPRSTKSLMSENPVKADIHRYFERAKISIIHTLSMVRSRIHISYVLWTSPNHKAMIAIVAHWTGEHSKSKQHY